MDKESTERRDQSQQQAYIESKYVNLLQCKDYATWYFLLDAAAVIEPHGDWRGVGHVLREAQVKGKCCWRTFPGGKI